MSSDSESSSDEEDEETENVDENVRAAVQAVLGPAAITESDVSGSMAIVSCFQL